jgi:hypothetical protein
MLTELETLMESLKTEVAKFERGNNTAGTRARKILQDIKSAAQTARLAIQEKKTASTEAK